MAGDEPQILRFPQKARKPVTFDRRELSLIMSLYGRYVAQGEWRDYAIDFGAETARFDIHRNSSEQPLYSVVKNLASASRGGLYQVVAPGGLIMRRGNDLAQVLRILDMRPKLETV